MKSKGSIQLRLRLATPPPTLAYPSLRSQIMFWPFSQPIPCPRVQNPPIPNQVTSSHLLPSDNIAFISSFYLLWPSHPNFFSLSATKLPWLLLKHFSSLPFPPHMTGPSCPGPSSPYLDYSFWPDLSLYHQPSRPVTNPELTVITPASLKQCFHHIR